MKISQRDGKWSCAEVTMRKQLGFGRYEFEISGRLDKLDRRDLTFVEFLRRHCAGKSLQTERNYALAFVEGGPKAYSDVGRSGDFPDGELKMVEAKGMPVLVVRLEGTNVEKARKMLADSGRPIIGASELTDAARKVVATLKA